MLRSLRPSILLLGAIGVLASRFVAGPSWFTHNRLKRDATDAFVAKDVVADILPPWRYLLELRLVVSQALKGQVEHLVAAVATFGVDNSPAA